MKGFWDGIVVVQGVLLLATAVVFAMGIRRRRRERQSKLWDQIDGRW
jgi:hypothetical protein